MDVCVRGFTAFLNPEFKSSGQRQGPAPVTAARKIQERQVYGSVLKLSIFVASKSPSGVARSTDVSHLSKEPPQHPFQQI